MFKQNSSTKFEPEIIESSLWGSFDAFIFVTRGRTVTADKNACLAFTSFELFSTCQTEINYLIKQNNSTKFQTENIKSSLWDHFGGSFYL